MIREGSLEEISDGKLYGVNDMVKADCGDCAGCFACCRGMGNSIVLDPLDLYRITEHLQLGFTDLLNDKIELNVADGIILPNLKLAGPQEVCAFLDGNGRCSIHLYRPGICRLFPLGRFYENGSFQYFLQVHECRKEHRTKIKVKKWIDTPDLKRYEAFVTDWHYFLKDLQKKLEQNRDGDMAKQLSMYVLKQFYLTPFDGAEDFYTGFEQRRAMAVRELGIPVAETESVTR